MNGITVITGLLLQASTDPDASLPEREAPLMIASRVGNAAAVKTLLDHGAQPNTVEGWHSETALMWAAPENRLEAVKLLIERGADPDVQATHLIWPEMKKAPAEVMSAYSAGSLTALMEAVCDISIEAAQALPNLKNPNEFTAMNIAVAKAHSDTGNLLVENGADPSDGSLREPWLSGIRHGFCAGRFPRMSIDASAYGG